MQPVLRPRLSGRKKVVYAGLTVFMLFGVIELVLRVAGFSRPTTPEAMAFTFPLDEFNREAAQPFLQRDTVLFWKPKPNVLGHNSRGIYGPEFADSKNPRVFRIVTLGDSCTHLGPHPYPRRLQAILDAAQPGRFEVINAGVIGYSSYQGLMRLRHEVAAWSPDLVTVYFGWNDHWLARGYSDREQPDATGWIRHASDAADHLRLYQLLASMVSRRSAGGPRQYRVSLDDYASNLRNMKLAADAMGARLWFITAPHALELGVSSDLVASGEAADVAGVLRLHERYNDQVRAVAAELGVTLVDFDRLFNAMNKSGLFIDDHIHLSDTGRTIARTARR